ncbi:hypothetical protein KM043_002251 [Ampulex compressa]|nr:hypothetical protein KM043_002251 [Ampulex compressa]
MGGGGGDETVGVCNCSGFNALLMVDGTRDWGNGLHRMSLLACEEERPWKYGRERDTGIRGAARSQGHVDLLRLFLPRRPSACVSHFLDGTHRGIPGGF